MIKDRIETLGLSFLDRNWLLFTRLAKRGFSKEKAEKIVRRMEKTGEDMEEAIRREEK